MASKQPVKKGKDLSPKSSGRVKGGKLAVNENMTLVRGAKPTPKTKDLPGTPSIVKGGRYGIILNDNVTIFRNARPSGKKAKDLAPKSDAVKGGLIRKPVGNDNVTLVRGAKPAPKKRDLPSRKDVTGGKKKE